MRNSNLLKAILFLVAGLLFFAVTLFFNKQSKIASEKNEEIVKEVETSISKFSKSATLDFEAIKAYLEVGKALNFSQLNDGLLVPTSIFNGEKPVYWSKKAIIYDYNQIAKPFKVKILKTNAGNLFVIRNAIRYKKQTYTIVHQLWLSEKYAIKNNFISSGLNKQIFPEKVAKIQSQKGQYNVFINNNFLFSLAFEEKVEQATIAETIVVVGLFLCFASCLVVAVVNMVRYLISLKMIIGAWLMLAFINFVLLFYLYYFKLTINQAAVFQWIDYNLMINLASSFAVFTLLFLPFRYSFNNAKRRSFINNLHGYVWLIDFAVLTLNIALLQALLWLAKLSYTHPFYSYNIFNFGSYTSEKLLTLLILIVYGLCYFMFSHLIAKYLLRRFAQKEARLIWIWIGMVFFISLPAFLIVDFELPTALLASLYLLVTVWQGWPNTLSRPRYITYLYLFFCILIVAVAISMAAYLGEKEILASKSKRWAEKINNEAGVIDFNQLKSISDSIKADSLLHQGLGGKLNDLGLIEQKILKNYISNQFDEYESNLYLFDNEGICLNKNIKPYFYYLSNYSKPKFRTKFKGIYKVLAYSANYYSFIPVSVKSGLLGYVVLEFKLRRLIPNSILPALFKERISYVDYNDPKPDFAIYKSELLVSESGKMNLQKLVPLNIGKLKTEYLGGKFDLGNYSQLFEFQDNKSILILYNASVAKIFASNFSFLFAILSGVLAIFIFSNTFYFKLRQISSTFTTKIQLFINIAFFLPLVAVSVASFSIMNNAFKTDLEKSYNEKAGFISQNLSVIFSKFNQNKITIDELTGELERAAKYVQSDIVIYDVAGKMVANTQPSLFDLSLLPNYISPVAYSEISERKEPTAILDESIGKFQYKTVYSPIKSYDSGVILGFVSIPFFESDFVFKEKVMDSITTILNIFTLIFILFLGTTYFFSSRLTLPLTMLTQKIKYTSLEKNNEPLSYAASDEIGILVKEYNRMLKKLEENKKALASSEKESAWREMAKQVAHEIKNPLTPMKLAIQNMQRMLQTDRTDKEEIALRSADVLLEQIENLNEIAGSFSSFAQMPLPKKERVELVKLIENVVFLFKTESEIEIHFQNIIPECFALGDENMISRIMINLVRNAIESVADGQIPQVNIYINDTNDKITVNISDNGIGIADALGSKIFQPNFSTKSSGSGIGLALAKRGLEQMGGSIGFESKLREGSIFTVKIPKG